MATMQALRRGFAVLALTAAAMLVTAGSATAEEVNSLSTTPSTTQAGGHPDIVIDTTFTSGGGTVSDGEKTKDARRIITRMPTGFIGNPHAVPTCSLVEFALNECSPSSQVGIAANNALGMSAAPVYNMQTKPDQAGLLAFTVQIAGTVQYVELSGRTDSDYGLDSVSSPIYHRLGFTRLYFELWGVPADPVHDVWRFKPPVTVDSTFPGPCPSSVCGTNSSVPPEPFLQNPTTCGIPLTAELEIEFYSRIRDSATAPWPATTGCDQLAFNPSMTIKPTTSDGDSASGLDANLKVPQIANPSIPSPSQIRAVRVTLPEGFSINPNAADGKLACSDEETSIGFLFAARCPEFAKVGTLQIDSSALPGPIPGAIYIGEPKPGDPYRLILTASGFATHVKLAGSAKANPDTGQIEVAFEDLPQSPLTEFDMHFFGAERGLMATPTKCGDYKVLTEFEPWNSALPNQESTSIFTVSSGPSGSSCPGKARGLDPNFKAGSLNPTAGRHSAFNLELTRADGEQNLAGLEVKTPPGFSGALKGIPYCPEPALATFAAGGGSGIFEQAEPTCPQESEIGIAITGAGAGSHPLYAPGKVYLAGPYKGAPLSLVVVVPAVSGPYDLGNVAVRAAIHVDPVTARVRTVSDPLPQILGGIPLRTRSIRVELDRPDFALNPTNCDPLSTDARVSGTEGAVAEVSSHYQVANCSILPFGPKLALALKGGTKRTGHPALTATLTANPGEANLARSVVTLPRSQILDNANIQSPCTRVQFAARACPPSSAIGYARAETPLLDQPLEGPVYLRSSTNLLPDLVADLRGQIDVEVSARVDSVKERIRTSFGAVPDVPVTKFTLRLNGGRKGLLFNSENLCRSPQFANVLLGAQNEAQLSRRTRIKAPCASASRKQKRKTTNRLFRARKAG